MAILTLFKRGQQKLGRFGRYHFTNLRLKQPTLNVCMKTSWTNFKAGRINEGFNKERIVVERGD